MGAVPQHQIMKDMLDIYNCERFERPRGLNLQTNTSRFTKYFEKTYNIHAPYQPDNKIKLADKIIIYPTHYFCTPKNGQPCYATHEFNASWQDSHQRRVKLALGQLAVIRFKENVALNTLDLPLKDNEKLLFKVPLGKGKTLALIKTTT